MPIGNGSGRNVDYEVEPSTPNLTNPILLSAGLTAAGAAFTALGCLADVGDPELTVIGLFLLVAALVADLYAYNGVSSAGTSALVPGDPVSGTINIGAPDVPHEFKAGTWVVFYDHDDPARPRLAASPPIFNKDATVKLHDCSPKTAPTQTAGTTPPPQHVEVNPIGASSLA